MIAAVKSMSSLLFSRRAALLLAALVAMSAAAPAVPAYAEDTSPPPPELRITNPPEGAVLTGESPEAGRSVTVTVTVENLDLVPPDSPNQPAQGHLHIQLNDRDLVHIDTESRTFSDLTPGGHTVTVEAVKNDHSSFDPRVSQTVSFRSEAATGVRWAWLLGGGFVGSVLLLAWYLRRDPS